MGRSSSFADKMAKANLDYTVHCSKCGESITPIKYVTSELSDKTNAWRFNQRFIGLCKCNEAKILG